MALGRKHRDMEREAVRGVVGEGIGNPILTPWRCLESLLSKDKRRVVRRFGLRNCVGIEFPKGELKKIAVGNHDVWVRKCIPDVGVAVGSFSGEFEILRYLLPADYRGVIVDAGGFIGTATMAFRHMFPQAKIIAIEPSRENLAVLKKNLSSMENVEVVHGALVGARTGTLELKNQGGGEAAYTVVEKPRNPAARILHETPAVTLGDLGVEVSDIGILKLDIEGSEADLLENDLPSLKKIPVVFAELHDRYVDGCTDLFFEFSKDRILIKDSGEKWLSIKR